MKILVLVDIDEGVHGDDPYTPLVISLLKQHIVDMETVAGASGSLVSTNAEGHTVHSSRIDPPGAYSAAEYRNSSAGRLMNMPKGLNEAEMKIK